MTTVNDVLQFLNTIAPPYMKMDWDNVGLLCGDHNRPVQKILVALDPFSSVCEEAAEIGAELIVTHHPLIFQAPLSITEDTSVGRQIRYLIQHNISAINAHTNLDCAPDGVNDCLARTLGLSDIQVIRPLGVDAQNRPWGLLRKGTVKSQSLTDYLSVIQSALGCSGLRYVDAGKPVHKVAVGGGACGDGVREAYDEGCDTFVTADVKYNQFWDAKDLGLNLVDAGHFHTENPVCTYLAQQLTAAFPQISVVLSQKHGDCIKFFR